MLFKLPKKFTEFDLLRAVVFLAIIVYILGVVPQFTEGVQALFNNPIVKVVFLVLIASVAYVDTTIGILLAVAFLISYMGKPVI